MAARHGTRRGSWTTPRQLISTRQRRKVLSALLDKLRSASAQGRRGRLAVVRTLTEKGGAGWH
jgi:hypothetical protein